MISTSQTPSLSDDLQTFNLKIHFPIHARVCPRCNHSNLVLKRLPPHWVKLYGQALRVRPKIRVRREDFMPMSDRRRTDQEIRSGALNATLPEPIIVAGSRLVVVLAQRQIWEKAEILLKLLET